MAPSVSVRESGIKCQFEKRVENEEDNFEKRFVKSDVRTFSYDDRPWIMDNEKLLHRSRIVKRKENLLQIKND